MNKKNLLWYFIPFLFLSYVIPEKFTCGINVDKLHITEKAIENEELFEFLKLGYKLDGVIEITSDLPIIDSGGQKAERKFIVTGPYLIKQIFTSFPTHDVIIKIKKE